MGLALPIVRWLIERQRARAPGRSVLTLGVQDIGATESEVRDLLDGRPVAAPIQALAPGTGIAADRFFSLLGFREYHALDLFGGEGASILHDLSQPPPQPWRGRFDLIIDGGTLEHIFDIPAALRGIVAMLRTGGTVLHVSPVAGWENHGFYSLQPRVLDQFYRANGFEIDGGWLARLPRSGSLRLGEIEAIGCLEAPFQTDSLREYTLLLFAARKREEVSIITTPIDTHQPEAARAAAKLRDDLLYWPREEEFNRICAEGEALCGPGPRDRYYTIKECLLSLGRLDGDTAECGVYRGLGSWIIRRYAEMLPRHAAYAHHLFDSFAGLSTPTPADRPEPGVRPWRPGDMRWGLEDVRAALARWSDLAFHQGWIPACFEAASEARFAFVHIDVDLYEPTRAALAFFYPRLTPGGIIIIDDDGFLTCPGARQAVDEFAAGSGVRPIRLTTGQAALLRR